ncbi:MAG TPA: BBP7 family outer membrane beta-barrel protein, partial [Gemmataceae bacterium]
VTAEWLYWVTNGYHVPPLVTASPAGTPVAASGVLSDPGTVVLLGGRNLQSGDLRNGLRVHGGLWLDRCETVGIEGSYFFLEDRRDGGSFVSSGVPQLSRPFFNASTGAPDAELVAFPGVVGGSVSVDSGSSFWGADANLRKMLCCDCNYRVDCLAGYRYLNLDETLTISEVLTVPPDGAGIPPGTRLFVRDRFRTLNEFHGGQIGLAARLLAGRAWADVTGKVALGVTRKLIDIGGDTTVLVPGQAPSPRPGGLLAQRTNSGRFRSDDFAVVPEATVRLGYRLTDNISAFAGYTFLYWSDVARPGDQIDTVLNPTQIPPGTLQGPARPAFLDGDSDFWVQGVSVGLEVRY